MYKDVFKAKNLVELASVASVGDFVKYDAGIWTEATSFSNIGESKNSNIADITEKNPYTGGWRVLKISDGTVTIIHAGIPAKYYFTADRSYQDYKLNDFCNTTFKNERFASVARSVQKYDFRWNSLTDTTSDILAYTGMDYWFADNKKVETTGIKYYYTLYYAYINEEQIKCMYDGRTQGARPVVVLHKNIMTSEKKVVDDYGNEAWDLFPIE